MHRPFVKMSGLGNDFVLLVDERSAAAEGSAVGGAAARAIADRRTGVGCDQVLLLAPAAGSEADLAVRIWNADGSEAGACGNGARCAAWLAMEATGREPVRLAVGGRVLRAWRSGERRVSVDLGPPALDWRRIPLSLARDTQSFVYTPPRRRDGRFGLAAAVSMGNPHVVFFVKDAEAVNLARVGPDIQSDGLFPEGANVGFAQVLDADLLRLRVWERGAGATRACGTGACAAVVAAARRGLTGRTARVLMDGGELTVQWREDNHVILTGGIAVEGAGRLGAGAMAA